MRALTVRAPWALMLFRAEPERKDVENRSKRTTHRGPVAIHVSSTLPRSEYEDAAQFIRGLGIEPPTLDECRAVAGRVIGSVSIAGCERPHSSRWYVPSNVAWIITEPRLFPAPSGVVKGRLGIWYWDDRQRRSKY